MVIFTIAELNQDLYFFIVLFSGLWHIVCQLLPFLVDKWQLLTYWGQNKMANILQTIISNC